MRRALLVGKEPRDDLGYSYTTSAPYDAVVIGSLTLGQLLRFDNAQALEALAEGKSVILYTPGLPESTANRALAASLASARRELKNWGVIFSDGAKKQLVTAQEARAMLSAGQKPAPGARLTPLAKEIFEKSYEDR